MPFKRNLLRLCVVIESSRAAMDFVHYSYNNVLTNKLMYSVGLN